MVGKRDILLMCLTAFLIAPSICEIFWKKFFFFSSHFPFCPRLFFFRGNPERLEFPHLVRSFDPRHRGAGRRSDRVKPLFQVVLAMWESKQKTQRWRLPSVIHVVVFCFFVWERTRWQSAHPEFDSLKKRSTLRLSTTVWSHQSVMFSLMACVLVEPAIVCIWLVMWEEDEVEVLK